MKERPRALERGRGRLTTVSVSQPGPQVRQRAAEGELSRRLVERGPFEEQADCEVSAQCHREVPGRHAVRPLFDLSHDAGPSSQGEQFSAQIVCALVVGDTKLGERVRNRVEGAPPGGAVLGDEPWERSGPMAALRRKRRAVDLQKAAMDAAAPLGMAQCARP